MREIRTSGSVRGEEGNLLTYSTSRFSGEKTRIGWKNKGNRSRFGGSVPRQGRQTGAGRLRTSAGTAPTPGDQRPPYMVS